MYSYLDKPVSHVDERKTNNDKLGGGTETKTHS